MTDIVLENKNFRLTLGSDSVLKSLVNKSNSEECLAPGAGLPLFSATQDRPYNNELKLAFMNRRMSFKSNTAALNGSRLTVGFEFFPFKANIDVSVKDGYIAFTLAGFEADREAYPMPMDYPPVVSLSLLEIPVSIKNSYGQWLNVSHTGQTSLAVIGTDPAAFIDTETFGDVRILKAGARKGYRLVGCTAALVLADTDKFLDAVAEVEADFDLPAGVESRRSGFINRSAYWTGELTPANVDRHIEYAKKCGFKLMLLYYSCMFKCSEGYSLCGDYDYSDAYPRGEEDMCYVLEKIKSAGITPGLHFLHTHIGTASSYVTPTADRRLHLLRKFTLSAPLSPESGTVYVDENPVDSPVMNEKSRLLRFDGEIISYESYSTQYPYCFKGCKRGHFDTAVTAHSVGTVGGVLDVSEYTGTSIYLDQNSNLQEEIAEKLAAIYDLGFEFIYFDGSEGTNAPFEYHVPNAQYRVYKKLQSPPLFCEGAAKAHFSWHMLSGGNAFDMFPTDVFKQMIVRHPLKEAEHMQADFTGVNFGWWGFYENSRVDVFEFGTSKAAAYNCPVTLMENIRLFEKHPRCEDIFEMLSRWEDVREKNWLTDGQREMLKDGSREFTLVKNAAGEYELLPYEEIGLASPLRAFVFERDGKAGAVLWDDRGAGILKLPANAVEGYTKEIDSIPIAYSASEGFVSLPTGNRAYIKTSLDKARLVSLIKTAEYFAE